LWTICPGNHDPHDLYLLSTRITGLSHKCPAYVLWKLLTF
jgi:hypothetical protein